MMHLGTDYTSRSVTRRLGFKRGMAWGRFYLPRNEADGLGSNARAIPRRWRRVFCKAYLAGALYASRKRTGIDSRKIAVPPAPFFVLEKRCASSSRP